MISDIIKRVKDFFSKPKQIDVEEGAKAYNDSRIKADPYNNKVDVEDAHSWNHETHPNGYEPSFLVKDIHFDNTNGDGKLDVTYRDGFTAEYKGITPSQAVDFHNADSKGRWALQNLWKLPYKAV